MATYRTSRTFDIIFLAAVAAIVALSAINRTAIGDWVFFARHAPSPQAIQVAAKADLSEDGRHLFYRSDPQFVNQTEITAQCDVERLGCLSPRGQSFILNNPTNPGQTVVTAAHEMLHLAYRRLPESKKAELAPLLDQAITSHSVDLEDELRSTQTVEDRREEAHSLLGTEYSPLPAALETYYQTYFTDRTIIVAAASTE